MGGHSDTVDLFFEYRHEGPWAIHGPRGGRVGERFALGTSRRLGGDEVWMVNAREEGKGG